MVARNVFLCRLWVMALNMSDDEDVDFRRQRFQHPDDADDMISESDDEAEQVHKLPRFVCVFLSPSGWHILTGFTLPRKATYHADSQTGLVPG